MNDYFATDILVANLVVQDFLELLNSINADMCYQNYNHMLTITTTMATNYTLQYLNYENIYQLKLDELASTILINQNNIMSPHGIKCSKFTKRIRHVNMM